MRYQPQGRVRIDWSNPLTRGLQFWQVGAQNGPFASVNGVTNAVLPVGITKRYASASSQYLLATDDRIKSAPLTFFALAQLNATAGNRALVTIGANTNDRTGLYVAAGRVAMFSGAGTTTGQAIAASGDTISANTLYALGGRVQGTGSRDAWRNGELVATNNTNVSPLPANRLALGAFWASGAPAASQYLDGSMPLALAWDRALSDDEMRSLAANPWQVFAAPEEDDEITAAGGGGAVDTGVAPGTGALAISGNAPGVTRTAHQSLTPATGALALAGHAPSVAQSDHRTVATGTGALVITGHAPGVTQSAAGTVTPGTGQLTITGHAPAVGQTTTLSLVPAPGALAVTGNAPTVSQSQPPADPRYARPASTISAGAWAPSAGESLAAMIAEPAADSATYIEATGPALCEVALNPVKDPGTNRGQVVRYMAGSTTGNGLVVKLKQGNVDIAEWRHPALPTAQTVFAQALTAPQCDAITDYADLRLSFEAF